MNDFHNEGLFLERDFEARCRFNDDIWTTRDGTKIKLIEMEDDHLKNALEFCTEHGPSVVYGWGKEWLPKLEDEINRRMIERKGKQEGGISI